jgi:CRISPR system Cascade subunit CasD
VSLLAGLFGNALGYSHSDDEALEELQDRIEFAARWDISPETIVDYHTVDLGQPKMCSAGWTTRGEPEHRAGGKAAALGTHQRYRHYLASGVMSVACVLLGPEKLTTAMLATALREPARPLFLGRKTCLPAAPLVLGLAESPDVLAGLQSIPAATRPGAKPLRQMEACWPARLGPRPQSRRVDSYDLRNWRNQIHTGRRAHFEGLIEVET